MRRALVVLFLFSILLFGQEMTYLKIGGLLMDFPTGGYIFITASADGPIPDGSYVGSATLRIIEENPDNSAHFYDFMTGMSDTAMTIDVSYGSDYMVGLTDSESEFIVVYAQDVAGALKSSVPAGINVFSSGGTAVSLGYDGPTRYPVDGGGPVIPIRIAAVDDEGLFVPSYFPPESLIMTAVAARIISEDIEDGSASLSSLFGGEPSDSVVLPAAGGFAYLVVQDSEVENVVVEVADLRGSLSPDTISVSFVDDEPIMLVGGAFQGVANTVGFPTGCIAMSMLDDGPDMNDDSTVVDITLMDIAGASSASVEPDELTLTAGVGGFMVSDDEADSFGVFVHLDAVSGTQLYSLGWAPIIYLPEGRAAALYYSGPNVIAQNDTVDFQIQAVDMNCTIDYSYDGYISADLGESEYASILDSTGAPVDEIYAIRFWDGVKNLKLTATAPEDFDMEFADGELRGMFDAGFLRTSQTIEFEVLPVSGTLAGNYEIYTPNSMNVFRTGIWSRIDIVAVDDAGAVDKTYSGNVALSITGTGGTSAELSDDIVSIVDGFGYVLVRDEVQEDVILTLTGELESPEPTTLHFFDPGVGGVIGVIEDLSGELIAGEERELLVAVMSTEGPSPTFSGTATITVDEPDDDGSASCPSSIEITNGVGRLTYSNSEPETVYVTIEAEGLVSYEAMVITHAILSVDLPETLQVGVDNEISMYALDYDGDVLTDFTASLAPSWEEDVDNGSFTFSPYTPIIADGEGSFSIRDDEAEGVTLYLQPLDNDFLIVPDVSYDDELGWEIGYVYFSETAVSERKPMQFTISEVVPNPFNETAQVEITMPDAGDVSVDIFDVSGHIVSSSLHKFSAGVHSIQIDGANLSSGIYLVKFGHNDVEFFRRAILIK